MTTWQTVANERISLPALRSFGRRAVSRWAPAAVIAVLAATTANAGPIAAGGGYSYFSGPDGQHTRNAMAIVAAALGPSRCSLTGVRYDDATVGKGTGVVAALAVPLAASTHLRMWGSRYIGDDTFRAWRVKAGPEAKLPAGGTIGVFLMHGEDNASDRTNTAMAELGIPLRPGLAGRATASYAMAAGNANSATGSIGFGWTLLEKLEVSGDVGLADNGALGAAPVPGPHHLLALVGGGGAPSSSMPATSFGATVELGVKLLFP